MSITAKKPEYSSILPPLRQKIDHYSYIGKESIIGKGFSSSVYKGRDDNTDQHVAIKIIDMKSMKGQIHKNLLAGQIQVLSMIKNRPNLLDVHKICMEKNRTYIITDFCEGGDLGKLIKSKKKLVQIQAIKIIKEIIKGYQGLYSLGIVHRDLKPANIFFRNSHLQIGDFGFAVKQQTLKNNQKYNVGSPVYMPPQALNSNKYSHKSDIWAIGVIFYEMLTGTTPWTGRTQAQLKVKMKTISIRNILPAAISKASIVFLKKSLQSDPNKRMDPYEMFQHFDLNHENAHDQQDNIYENATNNRLFRSMRKTTRNQLFDQTRGQSMKKTTNNLLKKASTLNPQYPIPTNSYNITSYKNSSHPQITQNNFHNLPSHLASQPPPALPNPLNSTLAPKTALNTSKPIPQKQLLSPIQKRIISKQLLSQVHFCRFLYKLIQHVNVGLSIVVSEKLMDKLINLLFYKLEQIKQVKLIYNEQVKEEYRKFADFAKLVKLVQQYITKYNKKLYNPTLKANPNMCSTSINFSSTSPHTTHTSSPQPQHFPYLYSNQTYQSIIQQLLKQIKNLYEYITNTKKQPSQLIKQIIILDYFITIMQLIQLFKNKQVSSNNINNNIRSQRQKQKQRMSYNSNNNADSNNISSSLEDFHNKSKIQTIVDGEVITEVSEEHVRLIGNKLKILKII